MKTLTFSILVAGAITLIALAPLFAGTPVQPTTLKVGAALVPHSEILEFIKPKLRERGIDLQIIVLDDEAQLNPALADKSIDANYFQHVPYLNAVSREKGYSFTVAGAIHVEPIGFYSTRIKSKDQLKTGATIGIPNNPSNEYRALVLLQSQGLIKLKPGITTFSATPLDIADNPRKFKFIEADAAQLPRSLPDLDGAVINTNIILEAKLDPTSAIFREGADSPYANDIVVRRGEESRPEIKQLVAVLQSKDVKDFIKQKYGVAVVAAFK
jgi:D-methionine transport system substrate-binding protein